MNKSIKIFLNSILSPLLFAWLVFNVYQEVAAQKNLLTYWRTLSAQFNWSMLFLFFLLVVMMLAQWIMEAIKWKMLLQHIIQLSLVKAMVTVFTGISFSIATPNRIGEFIGRVMYLPKAFQLQATGYTFIGNFAQLIITCIAGSIGLFFLHDHLEMYTQSSLVVVLSSLAYLAPVATLLCLFVYFKSSFFFSWLAQITIFQRWRQQLGQLADLSRVQAAKVLLWSLFRYIIFLLQYVCMFSIAGIELGFMEMYMGISVLLFILSILPTISLVELGLRWQLTILLFAPFSDNAFGLTMSTTLIWLLNMIVPAALGTLLIAGQKLKR